MAFHYVGADRDQMFLLATSMRDWLDEGHLAWFVIDVVEQVDTSLFHARHPNDGPGRPAYDPDMMLALLLYAYGVGLRSSRRIEAACRTDAAYRVICGNVVPDHATIARFVVNHERAIESVFVDVLRLCQEAGLLSVGLIALDGTKMGSDASLGANRSAEWIRSEVARILSEAIQTDQDERVDPPAGLFGLAEIPEELMSRSGRLARLQAALARLEAEDETEREAERVRAEKAEAEAAEGHKIDGRKPTDPQAALLRAEADERAVRKLLLKRAERRQEREAAAAAVGRKALGRKPGPDVRGAMARATAALEQARAAAAEQPAKTDDRRANTTDPDSRIMKSMKGWVQGYNAQAMVNENQIIIGHSVTQDPFDVAQYEAMLNVTRSMLERVGVDEPIGLVLADAGYWSEHNATIAGPDRLIATLKDHKQRRAARELGTTIGPPPPDSTAIVSMEHRLRTAEGAALYAKRSHTVEPVFGDIKENRGFRRFRRRGLPSARSEWALISLSHNLSKLVNQRSPLAT